MILIVYIYGILVGKDKIMDFIIGEKFPSIAEFIFSSHLIENGNEDYNKLNNTFNIKNLNDVNIVYLHTMYKNQFFDLIRYLDNKFIVITHNSDINISNIDNLPNNVIKWYSQNVNYRDERLESLPIGLENSRWFTEINKKNKIINKIQTNKNIKNLVYINHNINTNKKERIIPYDLFKTKKFATCDFGGNGYDFNHYIDSVYNHKFVICPEGNGIDTHRTWETLYLKTIPIEKRNINNSFYQDLPICFVNNWEEITEDFLNSEYDRIINNNNFNLKKLKFAYWQEKIKKYE
jgi:hypothetical protein